MIKKNLTESQKDKCTDQASKIVDIKRELGLIKNLVNTVHLVSILDKKEPAFSIHSLLIGDGGLENIRQTIESVLDSLEEVANNLFGIDES